MTPPGKPFVRGTVCHECHGDGHIVRPVAAMMRLNSWPGEGRAAGTLNVPEQCRSCEGTGRLPGFVPPA